MDKKQLFKAALISSPIMAAFEISPVFFLMKNEPRFTFWQMLLVLSVFSLIVWVLNIQLINVKKKKRPGTPWARYVFSYLLILTFVFIISLVGELFDYQEGPDAPAPIFLIINVLALNMRWSSFSDSFLLNF